MKKLLSLLACALLGATAWAVDFSGVQDLAARIDTRAGTTEADPLASKVVFQELTGENLGANGEARISAGTDENAGKIVIQATDVRMAAYGLGQYLREIAGGHISWCGSRYPSSWPIPTETVTVKPLYPYAIAYNYCTLSYTMAFWGEDAWQEEIDRLALQGYNIALVTAGLQKVWKETLTDMGYSEEKIQKFIADDAASAWWHMGNLEAQGDPNKNSIAYPVNDAQIELDGQYGAWMVQQMRAVGIEPIIQSFVGLIPSTTTADDLANLTFTAEKFAALGLSAEELTTLGLSAGTPIGANNVEIFTMGSYQADQKSPNILNPAKSAFDVFSAAWNKNLKLVYGFDGNTIPNPKFLGGDLFHEASTGDMTDAEVTACAEKLQAAQQAVFPGAKWVVQSWEGSPKQLLQNGFDPDHTLIQKLDQDMRNTGAYTNTAKANTTYKNNTTNEYLPWVWVEVINFGGNTGMHGAFPRLRHLNNIPTDESRDYFKGYGLLSEGLETNPTSYALFADAFAKESAAAQNVSDEQMATWLTDYRMRRYGLTTDNENLKKAHDLCAETVWNCAHSEQGTLESVFCAMPAWSVGAVSSWGPNGPTAYDREKLVQAAQYYLDEAKADPTLLDKETFRYDFVEIFQQVLADKAREMLPECQFDKAQRNRFRKMIVLLDEILSCSNEWRLDAKEARLVKVAEGTDAKAAYRRMITTWTPGSYGDTTLSEYAHRSYAGLIKHYYGARWEAFLDQADGTLEGDYNTIVNNLQTNFPTTDLTGDNATPAIASVDPIVIAEEILRTVELKTLTWNGGSETSSWKGENWLNDKAESDAWVDGSNAVFAQDANVEITDSIEAKNLTINHSSSATNSYGGLEGAYITTDTDLGWTVNSVDDLLNASYTGIFAGEWMGGAKLSCTGFHVKKVENEDSVTVQMQVLHDSSGLYAKVVSLKLTVASDGRVTGTYQWAKNGVANKYGTEFSESDASASGDPNGYEDAEKTKPRYGIIGLYHHPAVSVVITGGKLTVTDAVVLERGSEFSASGLTEIPKVELTGVTATLVLGDTQKLTINDLAIPSDAKLIVKGTASTLWNSATDTQGVLFKTAEGKVYQPTGTLVYVCTTAGDANYGIEQPLTVDATTGAAKRVLEDEYTMGENAWVQTSAQPTGWTNITLDELAQMEFTGKMDGNWINKDVRPIDARGYHVTKTANAVIVQMQAYDTKDYYVKCLIVRFTLEDSIVKVNIDSTKAVENGTLGADLKDSATNWNNTIATKEGAEGYGIRGLTMKPAVAHVADTGSNYADYSTAYTAATGTTSKGLSIINDYTISGDRVLGDGVILTIEPNVTLTAGSNDVPNYNNEQSCGLVVKGILDFSDHRWSFNANHSVELYTGGSVLGKGDGHPPFDIYASGVTLAVKKAEGSDVAIFNASIRLRTSGGFTVNVENGATLRLGNIPQDGSDTVSADTTITKKGAGTLVLAGSEMLSNLIFAFNENTGVLERTLAVGDSIRVSGATDANTRILSADPDYKVVASVSDGVTTYTLAKCVWVAKVTEEANATSYSEGVKFEDLDEAKDYLLTKLPDGRLWLYVTLDSDPEGWKSVSGPSGAELYPIAATVNGTAYRTLAEAVAAATAEGGEIIVVQGSISEVPEGWTIVDGELVGPRPTVTYTSGEDWKTATWTSGDATLIWADGMSATFTKGATLTATDVEVKTLSVAPQTWGGATTDMIVHATSVTDTPTGTDLGWTGLTVDDLVASNYSGFMGGGSMSNDLAPCLGYNVTRVDGENAVTVQMQVRDGDTQVYTKVACVKLTVTDGTVKAVKIWRTYAGSSTDNDKTNSSLYKLGSDFSAVNDKSYDANYGVRGLTIHVPKTVEVTGGLTIQDGISVADQTTLSVPGVTTIPRFEMTGTSATLALGDAQNLTIQNLDIPAGGKLIIKGAASTLPNADMGVTLKAADDTTLTIPVETVYYVCTTAEDPNYNEKQELMVEEASGRLIVVPKSMGTDIITATSVETGWSLTLAELSHMVFAGKMDASGTEGVAVHGYTPTVNENDDTLTVTMKAKGQTDVTLQFTVDATGAVWVSAPGVATDVTTGVFGLEVMPATAMTLTPEDAVYSTYARLADAVADVVEGYTVKVLTEDGKPLTIGTAMTLDLNGHALSEAVTFNAVTTLKGTGTLSGALSGSGNVTIDSSATIRVGKAWDYRDGRAIVVNGTLEVLNNINSFGNYTGSGTIKVLEGDNVIFGNTGDSGKSSGLTSFTGTLEIADNATVNLVNWYNDYTVSLYSLVLGRDAKLKFTQNDTTKTGRLTVAELSGSGSFTGGGTFAFASDATIAATAGTPQVTGAVTWPTSGTLTVKLPAGTELPKQVLSGTSLTAPAAAVKTTVYVGDVETPDYCLQADANGLNVVQGTAKVAFGDEVRAYLTLADAIQAASEVEGGATVTLNQSVTEDVSIAKGHVTLSIPAGVTITGALTVKTGAELTLDVTEGYAVTTPWEFSGLVTNEGTLNTKGFITLSHASNKTTGMLKVAEDCLTMKAADNGNGFKGTVEIAAGAELKPQNDYSMSDSEGTTVNIYGTVTLDCIWTVDSDVTWNLYSDGILQSNPNNTNARLNVNSNAEINLLLDPDRADTEAGKITAKVTSNALTYHVTGSLELDTLDLSTHEKDAMLTFANEQVVLTVKNLILGTNRGFMGTAAKEQLVVTEKVSLTEGPIEGSPIEVTWTMGTSATAEMTMVNGGMITTDPEGGFTIDDDGNLVFVTTLTGKGCWYEWLFDAGTLASTGRIQHQYSQLGTELGENYDLTDYYIPAPTSPTGAERKALKLSAKVLQDHLDYSESLEAPNWSSSFFARMPSNEGGVLVSFGSAPRTEKGSLALVRGKSENQVVLVYIREGSTTCQVLADMKVPHAETDYHLYSFVKYGDDPEDTTDNPRIEIFLDKKLWTTVQGDFAVSTGIKMGGLYYYQWSFAGQPRPTEELGTYTADVNGGRITLVGAADITDDPETEEDESDTTPGAIDMLRIYDCYLTLDEVSRIAEEYPYESPYGDFTRTISTATANWSDADTWTKTLGNETSLEAYPTDGVVTLTADLTADVEKTTVTVNMSEATELEGLTLKGSAITLSAGTETKHITVTGSTLIETDVNVDCQAISFEGPVEVVSGKTLTLTLTDALLTKWGTDYITNGLSVTKNLTGYITMGAAVGETPAATVGVVVPDVGEDGKSWTKTTDDQGVITFTKDNFILTVKLDTTTNCWTATLDHKAWAVTIAADGTEMWQLGDAAYTPTDTDTIFLEGATISIVANVNAELTLNGTTKGMTITKGDDATGDVTVTLKTPTNKTFNYLQLNDLILGAGVTVVLAGDVCVTKQPIKANGAKLVLAPQGTLTVPAGDVGAQVKATVSPATGYTWLPAKTNTEDSTITYTLRRKGFMLMVK